MYAIHARAVPFLVKKFTQRCVSSDFFFVVVVYTVVRAVDASYGGITTAGQRTKTCVWGGGTRVRGDLCYRERTARALNRRVKCDDARAWAYAKYFIFLRTRDPCENAEDRFVRHVVTYRLDVRARSFDGGGNINYDA